MVAKWRQMLELDALVDWLRNSRLGWQTYAGALIIWTGAWAMGSTALNNVLLSTAVFRFPYPLTLLLFQFVVSQILLQGIVSLTSRINTNSNISTKRRTRFQKWASNYMFGVAGDGQTNHGWNVVRRVLPLALVHVAKTALSALSFSQGQLPIFFLSRIGIIPISLILTFLLDKTMHTRSTVLYSLLSTLALLVGSIFSKPSFTVESFSTGLVSSFFVALYPILLLRTYEGILFEMNSQEYDPIGLEPSSVGASRRSVFEIEIRAFWLTLYYTSGFSIALLLPIVVLSGEPGQIIRNCYILDVRIFWVNLIGSSLCSWILFVSTLLLVKVTSPLTTCFLFAPNSALQLITLGHSKLKLESWAGVFMCWWYSVGFMANKRSERAAVSTNQAKSLWFSVRSAIVTLVLSSCVVFFLHQYSGVVAGMDSKQLLHGNSSAQPSNPHANWMNRPGNIVRVKDDYLGLRPHTDTIADLSLLARKCKNFYDTKETDHDGLKCLLYLASSENEYYFLPQEGRGLRASEQNPRYAEYGNADGQGNTRSNYLSPTAAVAATEHDIGTCAGPIVPYHIYWIGPATWRVVLFIKSYLFTQNLPCSRIWFWLDADVNPNTVADMLKDPIFDRFLPLVERGDIILKPWNFPTRVPLPKDLDKVDRTGYYKTPGNPKADGSFAVSDVIIQDAEGQQWITFNPRHKPFQPDYMSDAARFTILHLHGGLWCDMDMLLLRDMRPLLLPDPKTGQHAFAEQWVERSHAADYNSAMMSWSANSTLSSFLLHGGIRMGINFCPKTIGRMAWKENRTEDWLMLDTAAFDPSTTTINQRPGRNCSVPCHESYSDVFIGRTGVVKSEWRNFDGEKLEELPVTDTDIAKPNSGAILGVKDYILEEDQYPPNNRTLQNFFRGAWAYHIHNQWSSHPEPSSWLNVITTAQDGYFEGRRTNPYGEKWAGPAIRPYYRWPEFS